MHLPQAERIPVTDPSQLPDFAAASFLDVRYDQLGAYIGAPPIVLADYDQTTALATHMADPAVRTHVREALEFGHIASFGMASDNPLVRQLSGLRNLSEHVFTPYFESMRLVTKKNVRFYERIVEELDVSPHTIVMIGHHAVRDIANAKEAGLTTVQVPELGRKRDGILQHRGARIAATLQSRVQALIAEDQCA